MANYVYITLHYNSPHVFRAKRSHKENAELTERFSISENVRLI